MDMTPWYYVRSLLVVTMLSWCVLITGRIVECIMSERMLVTNPGAPPWTRIGRWYGWESGPITSKCPRLCCQTLFVSSFMKGLTGLGCMEFIDLFNWRWLGVWLGLLRCQSQALCSCDAHEGTLCLAKRMGTSRTTRTVG